MMHTSSHIIRPSISIDGSLLQIVRSIKLLGLIIDSNFTWNQHVSLFLKAAIYQLFLLRTLKKLAVLVNDLVSVCSAFIFAKLMRPQPCHPHLPYPMPPNRTGAEMINRNNHGIQLHDLSGRPHHLAPHHTRARYPHLLKEFAQKLHHPRHRNNLPLAAPTHRKSVRL